MAFLYFLLPMALILGAVCLDDTPKLCSCECNRNQGEFLVADENSKQQKTSSNLFGPENAIYVPKSHSIEFEQLLLETGGYASMTLSKNSRALSKKSATGNIKSTTRAKKGDQNPKNTKKGTKKSKAFGLKLIPPKSKWCFQHYNNTKGGRWWRKMSIDDRFVPIEASKLLLNEERALGSNTTLTADEEGDYVEVIDWCYSFGDAKVCCEPTKFKYPNID